MDTSYLLYPMMAHVVWVAFLYILLTIVRAPAVWRVGESKQVSWANIEPKISANLSNQFEWPLLFYVVCLVLLVEDELFTPIQQWLAWIFIAGRVVHSVVQILTTNIRLRGLVFTINFLAVLGMWFMMLLNNVG